MGLKLNELQKVVKNVVKNERNIDAFRGEITRTLGPTILISRGLEKYITVYKDNINPLLSIEKQVDITTLA